MPTMRGQQGVATCPVIDYYQFGFIIRLTTMERIVHIKQALDAEKASGPALRTFFRIAKAWKLDNQQQIQLLGNPPRSTYFKWRQAKGVVLPRDTLERISYIFGIYSALQILLPKAESADTWIKKPNTAPIFGGRSALERMLSGQVGDLFLVRQYLDAQRGG